MLIKLTNTINSIVRRGLSIVRNGLKMWLPFSKSEILGEEEVTNGDFATSGTVTSTSYALGWSSNTSNVAIDGEGVTLTNSPSETDSRVYATNGSSSNNILTTNNLYKLQYQVIANNGVTSLNYYSSGGIFIAAPIDLGVVHTIYIKNTSNQLFLFQNTTTNSDITLNNISIKEVTQIAPDISSNSNSAKLFTGKALSFNGNDAVTDFGNPNVNLKSICFWVNLDTTTEQVINLTATQSIEVVSGVITLNGTWSNSNIYVDGIATTSIGTTPQRVVVTTDTNILVSDLEFARIGTNYGSLDLADVQIYDAEFTLADALLDYNNPNHLIFDVGGSIALADLKGYWALSEGDGDFAYNSAVPLGSEEVVNGSFDTDTSGWTSGSGGVLSSVNSQLNLVVPVGDNFSNAHQGFSVTNGKNYVFTCEILTQVSGQHAKVDRTTTSSDVVALLPTTLGTHSIVFTATETATYYIALVSQDDSQAAIFDNVTIKEVSVGTINGTTPVLAQPTIPQLGMMDWAKSTIGSDEITLIADPNNPSEDILGNSVRLREHSLNLDGIGYAEVADADSLDFGTGDFSIEAWVKFKFEDTGSSYNSIYSHGGQVNATDSFGVMTTTDKVRFIVANTNLDSSSTFTEGEWIHIVGTRVQGTDGVKLYINGDEEDVSTKNDSVSNALSKTIGKDTHANRYYKNLIDDVRIYNRALSSDEVEQNHKAGLNKHKATSSFSDDFSSDYGF